MSITIEHLQKNFNGFTAVDNISFSVGDGEFVTLLGPSGSGKSTVLRCIAGLEMPDSGVIEVNGDDVTRIPVQERKVGFVFQHYALFRHMNILDNIAFGLKVRGVGRKARQAHAKELLDLVGLSGMGHRMPSQLSGGQRQRVALARALAPEPSLLLLDEPFGALDTKLRKELRSWLKKLHERVKLTSILVTHDQEEAFELSNRIVVMNQARVEQDAPPPEIFDNPATEFVSSFIGETNRVEAVVMSEEVRWGSLSFGRYAVSDGTRVAVHFRPHDVYVSSHKGEAETEGTIAHVHFMGTTESIEIRLTDGRIVTAELPRGLSVSSGFVEGKTVFIKITRVHIFLSLGSV